MNSDDAARARLENLARQASFAVARPRGGWKGRRLLLEVGRNRARLSVIQSLYIDDVESPRQGIVVSNVAPGVFVGEETAELVQAHVIGLVGRFVGPESARLETAKGNFTAKEVIGEVMGSAIPVTEFRHRSVDELSVLELHVSPTDMVSLVVGAWGEPAWPVLRVLEWVDAGD